MKPIFGLLLLTGLLYGCGSAMQDAAVLPSWNDGAARQSIIDYVSAVTDSSGSDFVPPAERIAVFDNDGTLWSEQPVYFQLAFAIDRVHALAPQNPDWVENEPFRSILNDDVAGALAGGKEAIAKLLGATHAGMTASEFRAAASEWIETAVHPTTSRRYVDMVYQPMLELLDYLRANGFKTYIVSGGGIEFMRPWAEAVYGIPPEQVVGSSVTTTFVMRNTGPALMREAAIGFIDDGPGKPVAINLHIGRRPIVAFGNSDGDHQMLQWTSASPHRSLIGIIHHTDGEREWAYDAPSHIGQLDKALIEAGEKGWTVVDMQQDWARIYP